MQIVIGIPAFNEDIALNERLSMVFAGVPTGIVIIVITDVVPFTVKGPTR